MSTAIRHSLGNITTKFALYPLNFLSSIIIARILGPDDRGVYSFMVILLSFLTPIVSLGFGGGVTYYIASKKYTPQQTAFTVFLFGLCVGSLSAIIITSMWYMKLLGTTGMLLSGKTILILDVALVFAAIFFMLSRILFGDSQFKMQNKLLLVQNIVSPLFLLLMVAVVGWGIQGCAVSILSFNIVLMVMLLSFFHKRYEPNISVDTHFLKACWQYGFKGWFGDMAGRANVRLDQIVLGATAPPFHLGLYAIAVLINELLWVIPDSVGVVLFTKIAAEKDIKQKLDLVYWIHRLLIYSTFLAAIAGGLVTVFVLLPYGYGEKFLGARTPFLLLLPGTILFITQKVLSKLLSGNGHIGLTSKAAIAGSCVSVGLYCILIPLYGIVGAAIASSIGYTAMSVFTFYYANRVFDLSIYALFVPNHDDLKRLQQYYTQLSSKFRK